MSACDVGAASTLMASPKKGQIGRRVMSSRFLLLKIFNSCRWLCNNISIGGGFERPGRKIRKILSSLGGLSGRSWPFAVYVICRGRSPFNVETRISEASRTRFKGKALREKALSGTWPRVGCGTTESHTETCFFNLPVTQLSNPGALIVRYLRAISYSASAL